MSEAFDPFAGDGPRWFAIEPRRPFLDDLAAGVMAALAGDAPEALADTLVLLPNRRAASAFTAALGRLAGDRPLLLPQIRPLGDLEEDEPPFSPGELGLDLPPAMRPLARRFEMARMVVEEFRPDLTPLRALAFADAFGRFVDSCALEEIDDFGRLDTLVEGDMARHWLESARLLRLAAEAWPRRLAAAGLSDPSWRRARLLRLLADRWTEAPPHGRVIAAGSTGTAPGAADVLNAVAHAPRGCVVLPGLDFDLDAGVWDILERDWQHPQHGLWRLLHRHAVSRKDVSRWPAPAEADEAQGRARQRLLSEALRPADATADWREVIADLRTHADAEGQPDPIAEGLRGLTLVTAHQEEDDAAAIALMMREALETPGRSCALVTPDLELGRRVGERLRRWGITPDDSAGRPLSGTPAGRLLRLGAEVLADPLDPHALLGLLKHPRIDTDLETRRAHQALERHVLRGPRLADWAAARKRLENEGRPRAGGRPPSEYTAERLARAGALVDRLHATVEPYRNVFSEDGATTEDAARALADLLEALGGPGVWSDTDGEAAAGLIAALVEGGRALGRVSAVAFAQLLAELADEVVVRRGAPTHPRLQIRGAIEARLVRADLMILAGLEDGVWPAAAGTDPFLSRPMRARLGLPPPERRLGQSAQDFVQAACAPEVVLVHRERRGGQPAVKSRWLWRMEMLARGAEVAPTRDASALSIARALDAPPAGGPDYARRPKPTPPVDRRPRRLPVTGVEKWVRDPYAIHARYILGLQPMDRPGAEAEAMARGSAIHAAVERICRTWPDELPPDCAAEIESFLHEALAGAGFGEAAMARERVLSRNCARWLMDWERTRRGDGVSRFVEVHGETVLPGLVGPFILTARADRIEVGPDGAAVIDFKTGSAPSAAQVRTHFAPQLTLTAAILADGGFPDVPATPAKALEYVKIIGRNPAGEVVDVSKITRDQPLTADQMAEAARDGLTQRIALFDDEARPYESWAAPQFMGRFGGDYDQLARVWEWHVVGGEEAPAE